MVYGSYYRFRDHRDTLELVWKNEDYKDYRYNIEYSKLAYKPGARYGKPNKGTNFVTDTLKAKW